jgi:hypothetical protein
MKEVLLAEYIREKTDADFAWGVCDCVLFAADWCVKLTGKDPVASIRGRYSDKAAAYIIMRDEFQNEPEKQVDLFFERVEPNYTQKGDVALCDLDGKRTFGIVGARGFVFFKMSKGIVATKKVEKLIVWRVE